MQLVGIVGNLLLLCGPLFELFRILFKGHKPKHHGGFILLVVMGMILNTTYIIGTASPIPVYNIAQNFMTIGLWCEIYRLSANN